MQLELFALYLWLCVQDKSASIYLECFDTFVILASGFALNVLVALASFNQILQLF